jgi:hypothetical protein
VHPSLFPLVYGRTRILLDSTVGIDDRCLETAGSGQVIPVPPDAEGLEAEYDTNQYQPHPTKLWSTKFQWLPCDIDFTADGGVKIMSYINNIHPVKQKALYPLIEQVMNAAVPLWDEVLGFVSSDSPFNRNRIPDEAATYEDKEDDTKEEDEDEDEDQDDEEEEDFDRNRTLIFPEPPAYSDVDEARKKIASRSHKDHLRSLFVSQGLQVIVKFANIILTPEKPEYAGGSWHVEGQLNERICATAIYYYDSENVTDSYLAFRQKVDTYGPEENTADQVRTTANLFYHASFRPE